jgi:undecaprenyl-diphosphatase
MSSLDHRLFRALHHRAGQWTALEAALLACARYGWAIESALMLVVGLRHGPQGRRVVLRCLGTVASLYALAEAVGRSAARTRPFSALPGVHAVLRHSPERSFPSRHVASAVAMGVIAGPAAPTIASAMLAVAAGLAFGRIRAGLHYPSDVVGGAVLGLIMGRVMR